MDENTKNKVRVAGDVIGAAIAPSIIRKGVAKGFAAVVPRSAPGDIPNSLSSLAENFEKSTTTSMFDSETGKIYARNSGELAHELGHKRIFDTVGERAADASMYGLYGLLKMPYLASPILSDTVMDAVRGKDEKSRRYRAADWVERNRGKTIALAAAPGLLHEAGASIIGSKLIKEHTNIPLSEYAGDMARGFASYALPIAGLAAYGAYKSNEYEKKHPREKTANPAMYAHLLDDAAILGTRLYNSNQINIPKIKKPQGPFSPNLQDYLDSPEEPTKPKVKTP